MKETVIVNYGIADQGKSATLKKVIQNLIKQYPKAQYPKDINYSRDVKVIIEISNIKIGIETMGDPEPDNLLLISLNEFVNAGCKIIICAARTYGKTFDAVFALRDKGYDIIKVTNFRSSDKTKEQQELLNDLSAKHIVELINELISNKI